MKNIYKNSFMALTLICAVALIIFFVQLIILNVGVEPREFNSVISESTPTPGVPENDDLGNNIGQTDDGTSGGLNGENQNNRPAPQGEQYDIILSDSPRMNLIIYAEESLFEFVENDLSWSFLLSGTGNAKLDIAFALLPPQGVASEAEIFLNNRSGGNGAEYKGLLQSMHTVPIACYHVSDDSGSVIYEAWFHPLDGSDISVAFIISYSTNDQRDTLYALLSTMEIES
ncbi:MAG: hypothetical protein FWH17_02885 [Oscillospiraceae bacterium]|nr:hypothetical protein [Oscillospiraceae bacterium]